VLDSYILELAAATRCDLMVVGGEWKQVRGLRWRWSNSCTDAGPAAAARAYRSTAVPDYGQFHATLALPCCACHCYLLLQYDQAVAFPVGFDNPRLVAAYNAALVALQESGEWVPGRRPASQPARHCWA
jgi:hypothetical protein